MSYKTGYKFNYAVYNFSDIMGKSFFISLNRALANILKILLVIAILAAAAFLFVLSKDEFYLFLLLILVLCGFLSFEDEYKAVRNLKRNLRPAGKCVLNLLAIAMAIAALFGAAFFFYKLS